MMKFKQEFTNKCPEYRYNKSTGLVEECGEIDLQEQINSCVEPTIDQLFDKLLYTREEKKQLNEKKYIREYEDRLDIAQRAIDEYNSVKKELGLDLSISDTEFNSVIKNKRAELDKHIQNMQKNINFNEVKKDEKKIDEKAE